MWQIWDMNHNKQLFFNNGSLKSLTLDSYDLEFSPKAEPLLITVSADRRIIQVNINQQYM